MIYHSKTIKDNFIHRQWFVECEYPTIIREIMPSTKISLLIHIDLESRAKYLAISKDFLKNKNVELNDLISLANENEIVADAVLIGPHREMILEVSENKLKEFCIEFNIGLSKKFSGIPIEFLSDTIISLKGEMYLKAKEIIDKIREVKDESYFETTQNYFKSKMPQIENIKMYNVVRAISNNPFDAHVNILAESYCQCRRQFQRSFKKYTGLSPKQFIMAQKTIDIYNYIVENSECSITDIVKHFGYYDHTHLNIEFSSIAGQSATKILENIKDWQIDKNSGLCFRYLNDRICALNLG